MESRYAPAVLVKYMLLLLSFDILYWYHYCRASSVAVIRLLELLHLRSKDMSLGLKGLQRFHPKKLGADVPVQDIVDLF